MHTDAANLPKPCSWIQDQVRDDGSGTGSYRKRTPFRRSPLLRFLPPLPPLPLGAGAGPASHDPHLLLEEVQGAKAPAPVKGWNKAAEDLLPRDPKYESY